MEKLYIGNRRRSKGGHKGRAKNPHREETREGRVLGSGQTGSLEENGKLSLRAALIVLPKSLLFIQD